MGWQNDERQETGQSVSLFRPALFCLNIQDHSRQSLIDLWLRRNAPQGQSTSCNFEVHTCAREFRLWSAR